MIASPGLAEVRACHEAGQGALVWVSAPADLQTPVAAFLRLAGGRANSFLLESVEGGTARGRYSVIGTDPDLVWRCRDGVAELAEGDGAAFVAQDGPAMDSLRALLAANRMTLPEGMPPMAGGLVGYLGYDMVRLMERLPAPARHGGTAAPDAILLRPRLFVIFDNVTDTLMLVAPCHPGAGRSEAESCAAYDASLATLRAAHLALEAPVPPMPPMDALPCPDGSGGSGGSALLPGPQAPASNMAPSAFVAAVERCKEYIAAGDVFQVVPSQRFSAAFALPGLALYRALRRVNPAPFMFFLQFEDFSVAGSSPEILVRLRDNVVTIRPLAGTRRRGAGPEEDRALADELLADPKERAEHLMLVDLGRNDVGRVAQTGSVRVVESFAIERFSHVMHISSEVQGVLQPGLCALDALAAGFPAGTLSGAPKLRAMEIIDELEPDRRGLYAGCIGYFGADGAMDTCIGLRTAVIRDGAMHVQAGCGVVADSDPQAEWEETRQKARALFRAAEEALWLAGQTSMADGAPI